MPRSTRGASFNFQRLVVALGALLPHLVLAQEPSWTPTPLNITVPIAVGEDGDQTTFPVITVVVVAAVLILVLVAIRMYRNVRDVDKVTKGAKEETLLSVVSGDDGSSANGSFGRRSADNNSFGQSSIDNSSFGRSGVL